MFDSSRILLLEAAPNRARALDQRLRQRGLDPTILDVHTAADTLGTNRPGDLAVVVLDDLPAAAPNTALNKLLQRLVADKVTTVVCGATPDLRHSGGPLIEWVDSDVGLDEVAGKVTTLSRYAPLVRGLQRELANLQRLGEQLNRYFGEIDQEMRLAGRLQRDFLPRSLPRLGPCRFEAFYRPASWVSGDMYDAFRIDENHLGMFVADAMGHGVAAGLLTMFLRQALIPKRVSANQYEVVQPADALEALHACLVRQKLPHSQFVTAAYGVVDTRSGEMTIARAGHPYPLLLHPGGVIQEIRSEGSLLGLADVPTAFEEVRVQLQAGDKLMMYTDGIEDAVVIPGQEEAHHSVYTEQFAAWAAQPAADLVQTVGDYLENAEGSLHQADDITILLLEIE
jgi:sigma-B regulation protein RsbU (phosphoserine phosphatase)